MLYRSQDAIDTTQDAKRNTRPIHRRIAQHVGRVLLVLSQTQTVLGSTVDDARTKQSSQTGCWLGTRTQSMLPSASTNDLRAGCKRANGIL